MGRERMSTAHMGPAIQTCDAAPPSLRLSRRLACPSRRARPPLPPLQVRAGGNICNDFYAAALSVRTANLYLHLPLQQDCFSWMACSLERATKFCFFSFFSVGRLVLQGLDACGLLTLATTSLDDASPISSAS
eukprot:CAMPEP_0113257820 /NCGR_PEP_ID=MMETSP0008_2-20120614/15499_1 /TAXON_ID=97485 /ORGANISM="Prymnesium parvum" /LENGTH=132 /DNA_ID=CAMNT_0000106251 /DNA_START=48 /DNA_END=442 /DNA_ORIENTATION=+ /assembly_acc=CAM_ASM_000153